MKNEIVLEIQDLKKVFGTVRAVDGVSLKVKHEQVYGFLGPNGSGKTTLLRTIFGVVSP